jgi:prepilin-type N-terminal cleavage/methylation domain-containing protein
MQKQMIIQPSRHSQSGFSLLEMTIVLAIMAVVLAGVLPYLTESTKSKAADVTIERLDKIDEAILAYYISNTIVPHTIPCPSIITSAEGTAAYGAADVAGCANTRNGTNGVRGGGVPVKALDLPDEYAFDGWGRRFMYHVDTNATTSEANFNTSVLRIRDISGGIDVSATVAYVIVSAGPNGHGAYPRKSDGGALPLNSGSVNVDEIDNCSIGVGPCAGAYDNIFIKHSAAYGNPATPRDDDFFDDVVRYKTRTLIKNAFGGAALLPTSCPIDKEPIVWHNGSNGWKCQSEAIP